MPLHDVSPGDPFPWKHSMGVHELALKMATKNGSSSGYLLDLLAIDFTRTA